MKTQHSQKINQKKAGGGEPAKSRDQLQLLLSLQITDMSNLLSLQYKVYSTIDPLLAVEVYTVGKVNHVFKM